MCRMHPVCLVALWVVAVGLLMAGSVWARPGTVQTRQGQTLRGDIVENDGTVTVTVHGVRSQISRQDIQSIDYTQDMDQQYRQRMGKLAADDVSGRMDVARWAFSAQRYDLARDAVDSVLAVAPENEEARTFQRVIVQQFEMERRTREAKREAEAGRASNATQAEEDATTEPAGPPGRYLTPEQINTIRQMELRPTDTVAVRFVNDVQERFIKANGPSLRFRTPVQQALEIIQRGDAAQRGDVRIVADPASIAAYRRFVQPVVLQGCASNTCHGGPAGGDLILYNTGERSDAVSYTNFYILQQYWHTLSVSAAAAPAPGTFQNATTRQTVKRLMIDRTTPDQSLLVQFALPRSIAEFAHPDVPGYRPIFTGWRDLRLRTWGNWITNELKTVQPNYGIEFVVPTASNAASQPSDRAEAAPPAPSAVRQPAGATTAP